MMQVHRIVRRPARYAIVGAMGGLLLLAGCSTNPSQDIPASPSSAPPAAHGGLADCLQRQGVADAGGPGAVLGPPAGVDQQSWDNAMKACSSLAPGPGAP